MTAKLLLSLTLLIIIATTQAISPQASTLGEFCEFWVAPAPVGSDTNPGTESQPWATMEHAGIAVPDNGCTVWFKDGIYVGNSDMNERYTAQTVFKAVHPYQAILQHTGVTLEVNGGRNMRFEGFRFRHINSPTTTKHVVIVEQRNNQWAEQIVFANNIFHDSYNNDLLKIHNGSRFIRVEGNVFYNQGASDQHIDVNSVTDVIVQDNIFFNDFAGSARLDGQDTKHFIIVKDSNENTDGLLGSQRVIIRRNIFLNWEGGEETFVQIGNDGKDYYEAVNVLVENNLMIGNAQTDLLYSAFGVKGAKDVIFRNNTVVGDLSADAYAVNVAIAGDNPDNKNIALVNNIWSDPTGTMGAEDNNTAAEFSNGNRAHTVNLVLDNNLYWNGGVVIPDGNSVRPLVDDARRMIGNPLLNTNQMNVVLPRWAGTAFLSGNGTIRQEFVRLVEAYGRIPPGSLAVGQADPALAAIDDIYGRLRGSVRDLGAYETETAVLNEHTFLPLIHKN